MAPKRLPESGGDEAPIPKKQRKESRLFSGLRELGLGPDLPPVAEEIIPGVTLEKWNCLTIEEQSNIIDELKVTKRQTWLDRSEAWTGHHNVWKGKKVLGAGGFGLCGLFKYEGDKRDKIPEFVVVKQSGGVSKIAEDNKIALESESRFLEHFAASNTVHIVKIFKSYHTTSGTGTSQTFDSSPFILDDQGAEVYDPKREVARIYLEFCDKGDLRHLIEQNKNFWYPEIKIWRIWKCLIQGLLVLECGSEKPELSVCKEATVHFDIKPPNILISTQDNEHKSPGIVKLADFGLARIVPKVQDKAWIEYARGRGTWGYRCPEQLFPQHPNRKIDTRCNIWSVAACIYKLMTGKSLVEIEDDAPKDLFELDPYDFNYMQRSFRTFGKDLLYIKEYSKLLRFTILSCLAYNPDDRPSLSDTMVDIEDVLEDIEILKLVDLRPGMNPSFETIIPEAEPEPTGSNSPYIVIPVVGTEGGLDILNLRPQKKRGDRADGRQQQRQWEDLPVTPPDLRKKAREEARMWAKVLNQTQEA